MFLNLVNVFLKAFYSLVQEKLYEAQSVS